MFDLVNGLPVHPLVVHAVVVLLPLAVLGTIAIAAKPTWRASYGWLVVGIAAVATVLVPVATSSGEALEERVGDPGEHAELGDQLIWFAIALLLFSFLMVYLDRRKAAGKPAIGPSALPTVVTVLAVVAALATTVQVYRVGDSGARAAWGDQVGSSSSAP
jgi:uncharacterized membrane protein